MVERLGVFLAVRIASSRSLLDIGARVLSLGSVDVTGVVSMGLSVLSLCASPKNSLKRRGFATSVASGFAVQLNGFPYAVELSGLLSCTQQ